MNEKMKVAINKRVAKKLAKLALFIYNDSKVRFDIKHYMTDDYGSCLPSNYKCATSCCALGYAVLLFRTYRKFAGWDWVFFNLLEENDRSGYHYDRPVYKCLFAHSLPDGRQAIVARIWLYIKTGVADEDAEKMYRDVSFEKSMLDDLQLVLQ